MVEKIEKKYKYWVFYTRRDGNMYAYTDQKIIEELFRMMRRKDIFYEKTIRAGRNDLKELHNRYAINQLELYKKFYLDKKQIIFPVTRLEKINIEHRANQAMVDLAVIASSVPIEIFSKKIRKHLKCIGWDLFYEYYHGDKDIDIFTYVKPDLLKTFLTLYGDTIEEVNFKT